ncbi:hypothetical protein [Endozoicomonas sp. ONNA1]|uniref:hypothetical protein n=1 Tax=Endozoicomonas sp. ONNA1 TaxID=2828740 RepID=UPI0021475880|nr:hypothetical protein [Endozoicomonas sp. ONNA1]
MSALDIVYNHRKKQGRIVCEDELIMELPVHSGQNFKTRYRSDYDDYSSEFLSYLTSLYHDGVLVEEGTDTVFATIQVFDPEDKAARENYYTYHGSIGFVLDDGNLFSEIICGVIEEK